MQRIAIVITTPPHSNLTSTAINYIEAAVKLGVDIVGVFFYQAGVLNASKHLSLPNDEFQTIRAWQNLHNQHKIPMHLCISAAERRGLSDEVDIQIEQTSYSHSNMNECFTISGLGELVELTVKADKVIQL